MKRRDFVKTVGIGSASLVTLSTLPGALVNPALASPSLDGQPAAKFTILLAGLYKPVVKCPDLGLTTVNVCDGTYRTIRTYPVSGLPLDDEDHEGSGPSDPHQRSPIGRFYFGSKYCAYDLPGGTIAMQFTGNTLVPVPDGRGGTFGVGTIDCSIVEATGVYQSFVGGHNTIGLPRQDWERISGHSARVGAAQDLLALNMDLPSVMQAGRWRDTRMPMRYGEKVLAARGAMARAAKSQGRA